MPRRPLRGVAAFVTAGLSNHPLRPAVSQKIICQELVLAAPTGFGPRNMPRLLQQLGEEAILRGFARVAGWGT